MINQKVLVVKDVCNEKTGTPSTVGQEVTVVVKIPANTSVIFYEGDRPDGMSKVRYEVYLTKGASSRINSQAGIVDRTFVVRVGGIMYEGDDVYTAEELGLDS